MSDNENTQPDNLVLEMLKGLRNDIASLKTENRDDHFMIKERLSSVETGLIEVKQAVLHLDTKIALTLVGQDKLAQRLGRVEDRLGLMEVSH